MSLSYERLIDAFHMHCSRTLKSLIGKYVPLFVAIFSILMINVIKSVDKIDKNCGIILVIFI